MRHNSVLINESGLYSLIMSSKLEKAKIFKRWITREVIPSIRKNRMYQLEAGSMISSLIPEITMVPQDPLKEEALQLAKKVDRTVCANTPCMLAEPTQSLRDMYIYYVGNRTVKAGFSKDVMPIRDRCHQKDVEFADCILVFVCKCRSSIEEEIHKQLWDLRANKLKTGKRETYLIEEGCTLQEFIDMISKYIEIYGQEEKLTLENRDLRHNMELSEKELEMKLLKKDLELLQKNNELLKKEKDFELSQKNNELLKKEFELSQKNNELLKKEKDFELSQKNNELLKKEKDFELIKKDFEIEKLKNSILKSEEPKLEMKNQQDSEKVKEEEPNIEMKNQQDSEEVNQEINQDSEEEVKEEIKEKRKNPVNFVYKYHKSDINFENCLKVYYTTTEASREEHHHRICLNRSFETGEAIGDFVYRCNRKIKKRNKPNKKREVKEEVKEEEINQDSEEVKEEVKEEEVKEKRKNPINFVYKYHKSDINFKNCLKVYDTAAATSREEHHHLNTLNKSFQTGEAIGNFVYRCNRKIRKLGFPNKNNTVIYKYLENELVGTFYGIDNTRKKENISRDMIKKSYTEGILINGYSYSLIKK